MKIRPHRNVLASRGNPIAAGSVAEVSEKIGRYLVGIGKAVEVSDSEVEKPQEIEEDELPSEQPKKRGRKPASLSTANAPV
jgi:hypothetical protein